MEGSIVEVGDWEGGIEMELPSMCMHFVQLSVVGNVMAEYPDVDVDGMRIRDARHFTLRADALRGE